MNRSWDAASNLGGMGEAHVALIKASSSEVKVDQFATSTGHVFIETESWMKRTQSYEPSGLAVSLADFFFIVIGGRPEDASPGSITIVVSREELRRLCIGLPLTDANQGGANPTRGYLLPVSRLLPMGTPVFRPVPCPKCGNRPFRFAVKDDPRGFRECHGPHGCGHVWDAGDAGREIVGWRLPKGPF